MTRHLAAGTLFTACLLMSTAAFAQTGTVSLGAGIAGFVAGENPAFGAPSYREVRSRAWLEGLPQLALSFRYCELTWSDGPLEAGDQTELALFGEYTFFRKVSSFSVSGGWLKVSERKVSVEDEKKVTRNYLAVGGSGKYAAAADLYVFGSANYGLNTKKEPKATILKIELGAEYQFQHMPGFSTRASIFSIQTAERERNAQWGYTLVASYEVGF
jgi:hypothetical protein